MKESFAESFGKEDRVLRALGALAENDRDRGVSPLAEARLIEAFRARRHRRTFLWAAVGAIAAALVVAIFVGQPKKPLTIVSKPPATVVAAVVPATPPHPVIARPVIVKHIPNPARIEERPAQEMVTDFLPLMDPAPPLGRGQILRVQLPATAMQAMGLPVGDDHLADQVQADVLVGEEGLPRAIRFVKFEMK